MEKILEILCEALEVPPGTIHMKTKLKTRDDWDSMAALVVVTMIEERMGKLLRASDVADVEEPEELLTLFERAE